MLLKLKTATETSKTAIQWIKSFEHVESPKDLIHAYVKILKKCFSNFCFMEDQIVFNSHFLLNLLAVFD